MDLPCQRILKNLGIVKGYSLNEIVELTGFSRKTVFDHLKHLVEAGLVTRDTPSPTGEFVYRTENSRGRPKVLYRKKRAKQQSNREGFQAPKHSGSIDIEKMLDARNTKKPNLPSTVTLEVDFQKLKTNCKHEKGGNCKLSLKQGIFQKCAISKCPMSVTHKIRLAK